MAVVGRESVKKKRKLSEASATNNTSQSPSITPKTRSRKSNTPALSSASAMSRDSSTTTRSKISKSKLYTPAEAKQMKDPELSTKRSPRKKAQLHKLASPKSENKSSRKKRKQTNRSNSSRKASPRNPEANHAKEPNSSVTLGTKKGLKQVPGKRPAFSKALTELGKASDETENQSAVEKRYLFDVEVLRCRFINWKPDAVHATGFCPAEKILAVARAGGDIEIYETSQRLQKLYSIPGVRREADPFSFRTPKTRTKNEFVRITTLKFFKHKTNAKEMKTRLFAGAVNGMIYEANLERVAWHSKVNTNGGAVWDAAVVGTAAHNSTQSEVSGATEPLLCVANEDGFLRLFKILSEDNEPILEYAKLIKTSSVGRILSLSSVQASGADPCVLIGGVDGMVRKIDLHSQRVLSVLELEKSGNLQPPFVYSLICLSDGTVVSGDSNGRVHFFDKLGVLIKSFKYHGGAVMALESSTDELSVFASGHDSRIVMFCYDKVQERWLYSYSHRPHTHNVFALQRLTIKGKTCLLSGGTDTELCTCDISSATAFRRTRPQRYSPFRNMEDLVEVSDAVVPAGEDPYCLLLARHAREAEIFKLPLGAPRRRQPFDGALVSTAVEGHTLLRKRSKQKPELIAKLSFSKQGTIRTSAMSRDGRFAVFSVNEELKLMMMDATNPDPAKMLRKLEVDAFRTVPQEGAAVQLATFFTRAITNGAQECLLATMSTDHVLRVFTGFSNLTPDQTAPSELTVTLQETIHVSDSLQASSKLSTLYFPVTKLIASEAGDFLVLLRGNEEVVFIRLGNGATGFEAPSQVHMVQRNLFNYNRILNVCAADMREESIVYVVTSENVVAEVRLQGGDLSPWSATGNGMELNFPNFMKNAAPACGISSLNVQGRQHCFCVWGSEYLGFVDGNLSLKLSTEKLTKRELLNPTGNDSFGIRWTYAYSSIVFVKRLVIHLPDSSPSTRLVLVEAPWLKIAKNFPDVLYRKRYGGNN